MYSERSSLQSPLPELISLRQAVATLELSGQVRQALEEALAQSEICLQHRLAQQEEWARQLGHLAVRTLHDVRNPLNAILLHAEVLEEEFQHPSSDSQEQMQASLTQIRRELTSLYTLIEDYLTLGRLPVIVREPEGFGSFVQDCIDALQEFPLPLHKVIRMEGLEQLGEVAMHKPTMRQALGYLLQQALDTVTADGTLCLRGHHSPAQISLEIRYPSQDFCSLSAACLANPPRHAEQAWTERKIFVARHILIAHGGILDIQREEDNIIRFVIILPLASTRPPESGSKEIKE